MRWKWLLLAPLIVAVMVYITYDDFGLWPSVVFFSLVMAAAFYFYGQDIRSLTAVMKPLAAIYNGRFSPATLMRFPHFAFEAEDRRYSVHAMASAGQNAHSGPFTSVQIILPFKTARKAEIKRIALPVHRAVAALAPELQATTGDVAFDKAFRLAGRDQAIMVDLLNDILRTQLIASSLLGLHLRLVDGMITVFMDGLAKTSEEIEEMISLGNALADRCTPA